MVEGVCSARGIDAGGVFLFVFLGFLVSESGSVVTFSAYVGGIGVVVTGVDGSGWLVSANLMDLVGVCIRLGDWTAAGFLSPSSSSSLSSFGVDSDALFLLFFV